MKRVSKTNYYIPSKTPLLRFSNANDWSDFDAHSETNEFMSTAGASELIGLYDWAKCNKKYQDLLDGFEISDSSNEEIFNNLGIELAAPHNKPLEIQNPRTEAGHLSVKIIYMHFYKNKSLKEIATLLNEDIYKVRLLVTQFKSSLKLRSRVNRARLNKRRKLDESQVQFVGELILN